MNARRAPPDRTREEANGLQQFDQDRADTSDIPFASPGLRILRRSMFSASAGPHTTRFAPRPRITSGAGSLPEGEMLIRRALAQRVFLRVDQAAG